MNSAIVMTPANLSADDTALHDAIAAISNLFPTSKYLIDYTIQVTDGVASILTWNASIGTQPTPDEIQAALTSIQLAGYKQIQTSNIQAAYENAAYNTPIPYMGTTFWTDSDSQFKLLGAAWGYGKASAVPDGFAWWDATGTAVPMTLAQLEGLAQATLAEVEAAFIKRKTLLASIAAATTVAEVQAVVW
jgi:hypothetical protein